MTADRSGIEMREDAAVEEAAVSTAAEDAAAVRVLLMSVGREGNCGTAVHIHRTDAGRPIGVSDGFSLYVYRDG